jgi:hypothetical protein
VVTAAAAALVATGGGGASGSQGGTADPGVRVVTARQTSTVSALAPGSEAQPLRGTFDNRSAEPVYVTAVRARVAAVEGAAGDGDGGCTADDYRIAGTGSVGGRVAPGEGRGTWAHLTIRLADTGANQDACQDARLVIEYTVR